MRFFLGFNPLFQFTFATTLRATNFEAGDFPTYGKRMGGFFNLKNSATSSMVRMSDFIGLTHNLPDKNIGNNIKI
jgi:hypothetical protein